MHYSDILESRNTGILAYHRDRLSLLIIPRNHEQ
jgi:hypothetical protein